MIKFEIRGFETAVTFGFLFVSCLFLLSGTVEAAFAAASACVIHELGHCFAAVILDVKFRRLKLWAGGISLEREHRLVPYRTELLVLICGPLFNGVFAAAYLFCGLRHCAELNISLAVFNLLPLSSLDGGCIIELLSDAHGKNGGLVRKTAAVLTGILGMIVCLLT